MKNTIKKITAIAMCGVLTVGSVLMTGAVSEYEDRKDFEVTGTTQKISNNQLFVTTTGYTENTAKNFGAMFISTDYQKYSAMFKDCIDAPKFVNLPKNQEFTRHMIYRAKPMFVSSFHRLMWALNSSIMRWANRFPSGAVWEQPFVRSVASYMPIYPRDKVA